MRVDAVRADKEVAPLCAAVAEGHLDAVLGHMCLGDLGPKAHISAASGEVVRDAHFTLTGQLVSGAADVQVKGEGPMVFKPASAFRMALTGSLGVLPFSVELISVGGNDYQRLGNARWTRTTSKATPASGDTWATAKDLKLVGEESLSLGKAWHLRGTANDQPFEVWVRESDGYPLKYVNDDPNASLTLAFDRFNTGQRVSEPAPSDIKPEAKTITGAIGQPLHLNGVDVTVVSVAPNYKAVNQFITPKPGNRFCGGGGPLPEHRVGHDRVQPLRLDRD